MFKIFTKFTNYIKDNIAIEWFLSFFVLIVASIFWWESRTAKSLKTFQSNTSEKDDKISISSYKKTLQKNRVLIKWDADNSLFLDKQKIDLSQNFSFARRLKLENSKRSKEFLVHDNHSKDKNKKDNENADNYNNNKSDKFCVYQKLKFKLIKIQKKHYIALSLKSLEQIYTLNIDLNSSAIKLINLNKAYLYSKCQVHNIIYNSQL